jgi:antitoxin CcdA
VNTQAPRQRSRHFKYPVNVSVRGDLLDAAREARINLSALLEDAIGMQLTRRKWREWRQQNAASIEAYNGHVVKNRRFAEICLRF